jgi:hypothetical protein
MPPEVNGASGANGSFPERTPSPTRTRRPATGLRAAVVITVVAAVVFGVSMYELLRGDLSTFRAELSAAVALVAFGMAIYGLLQIILTLIESAGERRRQEREATERRKAARATRPPGS